VNSHATQAYSKVQKSSASPRDAEALAFAKAMELMKDAQADLSNFETYADALQFNQRLWTVIQANLTGGDNPLPEQLRTDILTLSVFVDRHTVKALADPRAEHLDVLIGVNKNIMGGLLEGA